MINNPIAANSSIVEGLCHSLDCPLLFYSYRPVGPNSLGKEGTPLGQGMVFASLTDLTFNREPRS